MSKNKKFKVPNWIKLDNAATIYPSTLSRKYAAMFRMSVTLTEEVDREILTKALSNIIDRFPAFRYKLKKGIFWCYFKHIKGVPTVQEDSINPMLRIDFKKNKGFMFRVRHFDKRIAIEYFHALTDGTGGITFLLTLTAEYLKLKHNLKIQYNDKIFNPKDKPKKDEYSDSFKKFARKIGGLEKEVPAYHQKGKIEPIHIINIITGTINVDELKKVSKSYNCTVTQFIVSLMLLSLQEIQEKERTKQKNKKPIKIFVPINLRKIYPTNTMRNFSSYANIGIDTKYGHYEFEEIISIVKSSMDLMLTEKRINAKISANVKLSRNIFIRIIPMFLKKRILSMFEYFMGDNYCSCSFSNLGFIDIPKNMLNYIDNINFMIGRSRTKPTSCSCVSCGNKLYISFSRKIKEPIFERLFFTKLVEMNIPVEIESNKGR